MSKRISSNGLMFSVAAFIIGSSLLTNNLYTFAKNGSWLPVIIGFVVSLAIAGVYIALVKRHPGMSFAQINEAVFGKIIGKAVSALYVFYFLSLTFLNTRDLGDFVNSMVLPATPIMIVVVIFLMVCAWAVRKGSVVMARYGFILAIISIGVILFNFALLYNRMEPKNFQPVFTLPLGNYLIGTHIVVMLTLGEIIAFLPFAHYTNAPREFGRGLRGGLTIGAATLLFVVLRDILVLGDSIAGFSLPIFTTIRLIDVGDIVTRLEILYAVILISLLFFKVAVVYFATVSGIAQLFGLKSFKSFIYIIGALTAVYSMATFSSIAEHNKWNLTAAATYSTFFILLLPMVTLIVSSVRQRMNQQPDSSPEKS